ncbi:MAG: hypothetical protein M2R45_00424 [Verrucomicrobia subdivision 3 bacterium]|nr:hypothetical protein [Limisphaerales bacterium]MCS1413696.1 hypothetical protein [Limisphaerales bacterium]
MARKSVLQARKSYAVTNLQCDRAFDGAEILPAEFVAAAIAFLQCDRAFDGTEISQTYSHHSAQDALQCDRAFDGAEISCCEAAYDQGLIPSM